MERQSLSVSELNNLIKGLLEQEPSLSNVCVRGELSNYKIYPSGHHYFTLKDSESSLRCVMFKSSAVKLRFRPENGMGVTVYGRVAVYPRDGAYQLYCSAIMPEGAGDLQVAFEQLKAQLASEGLFERSHKKPLPQFPKRIAIITSSAGAAVHDMIRILGHRWPMAQVVLLPVRVQGTEAPPEIAGAIRYANEFKVADLIITGRGGGSMEDLWAFNDERVARAIYDSGLPVISAVGHEPDVTIADYVADVRASTPSNAAEIAVPDWHEVQDALNSYGIRADQAMRKKLLSLNERLESYKNKRVMTDPTAHIDNRRIELDHVRDRLAAVEDRKLSRCRQSFVALTAALDAMSPLRVLSRGYAIAEKEDGSTVKSVDMLSPGDGFCLQLWDGKAQCRVSSVSKRES
ncbi:MAG TPA: exodeoxyribonuclease VII large subunit [Candidatus Limivicinus faecipullorum]|nr:exodeoxyribonuclease VII large subunit [Candidatus Limivicinus faecipullorum]